MNDKPEQAAPSRFKRHLLVFLFAALFGGAAYAVIRVVIWMVEVVIGR